MNNLKIVSNNSLITHVFVEGQELHYIKSINFNHTAGEIPIATIELMTNDVEICIDKAEIIKKKASKKTPFKWILERFQR